MAFRLYEKLIGVKKQLPNPEQNYVKILCWNQTIEQPGKHIALEIQKDDQTHYLSLAPLSIDGVRESSVLGLRKGREAFFKKSFDDEVLYIGHRNAYHSHDSYEDQLASARKQSSDIQNNLRKMGQPDQTIVLHSLNLDEMIKKIGIYKGTNEEKCPTKWASWSSAFSPLPFFREEKTYNCASIVLSVLYAGGFNNLVQNTYHNIFGILGAITGIYSGLGDIKMLEIAYSMVKYFAIGRGIGGICEGWTDIQSLIDLSTADATSKGAKSNALMSIGIRMGTTLLSSVVALLQSGPLTAEYILATPQNVMNRVTTAKVEEDATYAPFCKKM